MAPPIHINHAALHVGFMIFFASFSYYVLVGSPLGPKRPKGKGAPKKRLIREMLMGDKIEGVKGVMRVQGLSDYFF